MNLKSRFRFFHVIPIAGLLLCPGLLKAQATDTTAQSSTQEAQQGTQTDQKTTTNKKKDKTVYFGSYRLRVEDYNWFATPKANGAYTFVGSLLRFGVKNIAPTQDMMLEFEQPTLINLPKDATGASPVGNLGHGANYYAANRGQSASLFIRQANIQFKNVGRDPGDKFEVGRFEFGDGMEVTPANESLAYIKQTRISQRLLSPNNFTTIGRSYDGFQFNSNARTRNVTAMAAMPTRGVYSLDGWDTIDQIKTAYVATTFEQPGVRAAGEGRLFGVYYQDDRPKAVKVDNRSTSARTKDTDDILLGTLGGHYIYVFNLGPGQVDGTVWGAGQFGNWGDLTQAAYAGDVELGYRFNRTAWKPWLRMGYSRSSGDGNPKNDVHGTFVTLLPTSSGFSRYPFYNQMNLKDFFGQLILMPTTKLTLRSDVHGLKLSDPNDLWYQGSGAYENINFGFSGRPSGGNSNLATLYDLSAEYRALKDFTVTLYMAYARGGDVVAFNFTGKNAAYGYVELRYTF